MGVWIEAQWGNIPISFIDHCNDTVIGLNSALFHATSGQKTWKGFFFPTSMVRKPFDEPSLAAIKVDEHREELQRNLTLAQTMLRHNHDDSLFAVLNEVINFLTLALSHVGAIITVS